MDRIETNFRLALLSIRDLKVATTEMKSSVEKQEKAIDTVVETLEAAYEGLRVMAETQDGLVARMRAAEAAIAELQKRAS